MRRPPTVATRGLSAARTTSWRAGALLLAVVQVNIPGRRPPNPPRNFFSFPRATFMRE